MSPRCSLVLLLVLSASLAGCKRQDPDAGRRPASAVADELAQARGQLTEIQTRLTRTEAELEEANRRLVREKVENAKLRQELNARRKKNGY